MKKFIGFSGLLFLLSACSGLSPQEPVTSVDSPVQPAKSEKINSWNIFGQVGIRSAQGGQSASFNWYQQNHAFNISLTAPLGAASASIHGTPGDVVLQTSKGEVYRATNAESLLYEKTGWRLPVKNLYYWIRALPAPDSRAKITRDQNSLVRDIQQAGWDIQYSEYRRIKGINVPTRLRLNHPDLEVRIAINTWRF